MEVSTALTRYLQSIKTETTQTNYKIALIDFLSGVTSLNSIDVKMVRDHKNSLSSAQTEAARLAAIRGFLDYCWGEGWIRSNPALAIKNTRVSKYANAKNISIEDLQKVLLTIDTTTQGLRDNLIIRLLYFTGDVDKVKLLGWQTKLPANLDKLRTGYQNKLEKYLLANTDFVWEDIKDGYMFFALEPKATPFKTLSKSALRKLLQKYSQQAGFDKTHIDFQALKRLRAREIWRKTKSVEKVRLFCGHKSTKATKAFIKTLPDGDTA